MKFKKIFATLLVAVCAFMLVGCGQMNAKEAVQSSVSSSTEIQTTATDVQGTSFSPSMASSLSATTYSSLTDKIGEVTTATSTLGTTLVSFGNKVLALSTAATTFVENYENYEITEEDVAKLNEYANKLEDVKNDLEAKANELANKATDLASKILESLTNKNLSLDEMFTKVVEIINYTNTKLVSVSETVENITDVINNYNA